jgi:hypothetical protein
MPGTKTVRTTVAGSGLGEVTVLEVLFASATDTASIWGLDRVQTMLEYSNSV